MDIYASTGQGFIGNIMFAYCGNNPVMRVEVEGEFWETLFDVISLGASIVEVCINLADPWEWAGLVGDTVDLISFVTGVGEGIKTVKITKKVVGNAGDVLEAVNDIYKGTEAADDIRKATGSYEIL